MVRRAFEHDSITNRIPVFIYPSVRILQRRSRLGKLKLGTRLQGTFYLFKHVVYGISIPDNSTFMDVFANEHNCRNYRRETVFRAEGIYLDKVLFR